jgi:hypothetical protein
VTRRDSAVAGYAGPRAQISRANEMLHRILCIERLVVTDVDNGYPMLAKKKVSTLRDNEHQGIGKT